MQAPYIVKARYIAAAATFSLLLNSVMAQTASTTTTDTTTTTTTSSTTVATPAAPENAAPTVLSPFEVSSTEDTGYRAQNTLAGSRVNTQLRDLASPITVITKDFLDDIGAVDVNDILTYEVGAEGTKDFSSTVNSGLGARYTDNVAADPNGATRGRGLASFDITRDYFYSLADVTNNNQGQQSVGFDTYNLDSVTIVRGADSILAGLGSPAGIINFSPQLAGLEKNSYDLSYRLGSYDDKRATANANIVAIPNVLAFRFAGEWSDKGFEQQPAYDHDKRYYLATTWKPFKTTTIHASYEHVSIVARYPNTFTPEDDITQYLKVGSPSSSKPGTGATYLEGQINGGEANAFYAPNGQYLYAYNTTSEFGFTQQNLSNVGIWSPLRFSNNTYGDWHKINTDGTSQDNTLSTEEISVDQELFPNLNANISYVHELANYGELSLGRTDYVQDMVDVNKETPWGAANPYYGSTFMYYSGLDNEQTTETDNVVGRASLTYDLDLTKYNKWFGRWVFTGFSEQRHTQQDWKDSDLQQVGGGQASGSGNGVGFFTYTGGNASNNYYQTNGPVLPNPAIQNQAFYPTGGNVINNTAYTGTAAGVTSATPTNNYSTYTQFRQESKSLTKLTTNAFVLQTYLLDNLAVGTFGIRHDKDEGGSASASVGADGVVDPLPSSEYANGALATTQAETKTYVVVLHGPKMGNVDLSWLTIGYNQSQNFVPLAGSVDLLGNPTPSPTGVEKDYNIAVDLLGGRLNAKIDWFTSEGVNAPDASVNFPLVQWVLPYEDIVSFGDLAKQAGLANYSTGLAPGLTYGSPQLANAYGATTVSKGMEFELTYNVTKNWRVFGTLTREQAEQSNIAPALTTFINARVAYWQANGLWNGPHVTTMDWGGTSTPETGQQVYNNQILPGEVAYQSVSGQLDPQLHKWKATLVTNYTFDDGIAKGFLVGTGIRYLDKTYLGSPANYSLVNGTETVTSLNIANSFYAPAQTSIEGWVGYSRKILDNKYLLSFRLEIDNLTASNNGYFPVLANSDGTHANFSIEPPRTYEFTTELKF